LIRTRREEGGLGLDPNNLQGQYGESLMMTLAASSGLTWSTRNLDRDGVDLSLHYPGRLPSGVRYPQLDIQVKTESSPSISKGHISYQLRRKNYEDLRGVIGTDFSAPRLLVVVTAPRDSGRIAGRGSDFFVFRHSAYWHSLMDAPAMPESQDSKVVHVPLNNQFDPLTFMNLMARRSWSVKR
jgi:hypothetical protein